MTIVDGNNVAHSVRKDGKPSIKNLEIIKDAFKDDLSLVIVVTSSLRFYIDDPDKFEQLRRENSILQLPPNFDDDQFILDLALEDNDIVISNDKFKNYNNLPKGWLDEHRIEYVIVREKIYFSKNIQKRTDILPHQNDSPVEEGIL